MQLIHQNVSGNTAQVYTQTQNSNQDQNHIYTLESLVQTLEEVAQHLKIK